MTATVRLLACCALLGIFAGCATPGHRARQHPAAFHKLSPSDQNLVLKGKIRPGLGKDAVYIAWGEPDWKLEGGKDKEVCESWIYYRQITTYLPLASYDMHSPSIGLYGPDFAMGLRPGYGFGGVGSTGFLYQPRTLVSDVRFKRADFRDGSLRRYEVRRGSHLLLPYDEEPRKR